MLNHHKIMTCVFGTDTNIFTSRNVFFAYFVDVLFGSCSLQIRLVIAFFFTFLNLRYTELLFQIWYQMQLQNHFAVQSFIASNWSWFLSSHFQFTIFVYLVRINVSFKDIWKRLSVCLKKKMDLWCVRTFKFVHRQCYQIKCLEK